MLFCLKVTVNGMDYQPQTASPNKKHAKAMAATVALQALGEVILNRSNFVYKQLFSEQNVIGVIATTGCRGTHCFSKNN